jgi:subtilisin family serine protease
VETAGLRENRRVTGTSFAAPFVAGAAALLISRGLRCSYALGADEVASLLRRSVHAWPRGPDGCGAGVLDARAALDLLDESIDSERTAHAGPDPAALQNPNHQSPIRA